MKAAGCFTDGWTATPAGKLWPEANLFCGQSPHGAAMLVHHTAETMWRRYCDMHTQSSRALLCAGRRDFGDFMSQYVAPVPGQFVDVDSGRVLGPCSNILAVTWGQRSAIGGMPDR